MSNSIDSYLFNHQDNPEEQVNLFRGVIDSLDVATCIVQISPEDNNPLNGVIAHANDSLISLVNLPSPRPSIEDSVTVRDIFANNDEFESAIKIFEETGKLTRFPFLAKAIDGSDKKTYCTISITKRLLYKNNPIFALAINDSTEILAYQKRIQEAEHVANQHRNMWETMFENGMFMMYMHENGIVTRANKAITKFILGDKGNPEDLIGVNILNFAPEGIDRDTLRKRLELIKDKNINALDIYETKAILPSGKVVTCLAMTTVAEIENKRVNQVMVMDVTEIREISNLKRQIEILGQFASTLAHQMKSPIAALSTSVYLAGKKINDPTAVQGYLNKIDTITKRIASVIDAVYDYTQLQSGNRELELKPLDFQDIVQNVLSGLEHLANQCEIDVQLDINQSGSIYLGDPVLIPEALEVILENAIKYTPRKGRILISTDHDENYMYINVKDNGKGLSEEDLDRIFLQFSRGSIGTESRHQGLGIGLNLAKLIAEAHGGEILARNNTDSTGATFTIKLPWKTQAIES